MYKAVILVRVAGIAILLAEIVFLLLAVVALFLGIASSTAAVASDRIRLFRLVVFLALLHCGNKQLLQSIQAATYVVGDILHGSFRPLREIGKLCAVTCTHSSRIVLY